MDATTSAEPGLSCWSFDVQRGPDWVLVGVRPRAATADAEAPLCDELWHLLEQHSAHRLLVDLSGVTRWDAALVAQLATIYNRILSRAGQMRICGVSPSGCEALRRSRLDMRLPMYPDRATALRTSGTIKPR